MLRVSWKQRIPAIALGVVSLKLYFYPCSGPPLPEVLELLAPLASSLEELDLSENKLGGSLTPKIGVFAKLKVLKLSRMGLEGACDCSSNPVWACSFVLIIAILR